MACASSFIREELSGCLHSALFNRQGQAFAQYYYGENDQPYYPADIDDYALEYFGKARYHSDEFQEEAYLFLPFDEDYYQAMAKVIERRFTNWQSQDFDEDTLEPSELAQRCIPPGNHRPSGHVPCTSAGRWPCGCKR